MKILLVCILFFFYFQSCSAVPNGCNCVVFRLDDIQDYYLSGVQRTLLSTFRDRKLPLTVGVIANLFGEDSTIVNSVKTGLADSTWEFEIADHGWNHEDFSTFTYSQQLTLLQDAVTKIKTVLPSVKTIKSFIPPFNAWNSDTATALTAINITYMSSQIELDPSPYPFSGQSFYRFPEGATTWLEGTGLNYAIGVSAAYTMDQVRRQMANYGFAVIMMHPMEFTNVVNGQYPENASLNQTQYNELLNLIAMVQAENYTLTTLSNIPQIAANVAATTTSSVSTSSTSSSISTSTTGSTTGGINLKNCSCVVFRLDDIQDWWLNSVQTTLLDAFRSRRVPLTAGVIANIFGQDSVIVNKVRTGLSDSNWTFEIAEHGWNHEDFSGLAYAQQLSLIQQSTTKLASVLPQTSVKSFIPPFNAFNEDTVTALITAGYTFMSSSIGLDIPTPMSGQSFYRFPTGASTSAEGNLYRGIPATETMNQIRDQISTYGYSVVMMHPQEFSNIENGQYVSVLNQTQYQELINLIEMVQQSGLKIVTLNAIPTSAATTTTTTTSTTSSLTTGPLSSTSSTSSSSSSTSSTSTTSSVTTGPVSSTTSSTSSSGSTSVATSSTSSVTSSSTSSTTSSSTTGSNPTASSTSSSSSTTPSSTTSSTTSSTSSSGVPTSAASSTSSTTTGPAIPGSTSSSASTSSSSVSSTTTSSTTSSSTTSSSVTSGSSTTGTVNQAQAKFSFTSDVEISRDDFKIKMGELLDENPESIVILSFFSSFAKRQATYSTEVTFYVLGNDEKIALLEDLVSEGSPVLANAGFRDANVTVIPNENNQVSATSVIMYSVKIIVSLYILLLV